MTKRIGVVFDFDGTLTNKARSLFQIVDEGALPWAAAPDFVALRDKFLPLARAGKLSPAGQAEWLSQTFEIYANHGLRRTDWRRAVRAVSLREGVVDTIAQLRDSGVFVAIVSYGCADFIDSVLRENRVVVDEIYASRLVHSADARGIVLGSRMSTHVTQTNKGDWSRRFADDFGVQLGHLLAVGDSSGDKCLGDSRERRVGIAATQVEADAMREHFAEVLITEDFAPVRQWLTSRVEALRVQ